MARIPVPERGQPLDLSYVYQLANAVNELSDEIAPATYNYVSVDTQTAGTQVTKTSASKLVGGYINVINNTSVTAGEERTFSYTFPGDFKYAPIVTATPVNIGNTPAGKNVIVILKSITTSRVDGLVRFNTTGDGSVGINLIMLGIPN